MDAAKQFIDTLLGLLIAFLLPGLAVIISIGLLYEPIGTQLIGLTGTTAPTGLSVFLFLAAILAGVQLNVVRWAIYVKILGRKHAINPKDMAALGHPKRAEHFRLVLDQVMRFHQFAGAQSLALPFFAVALFKFLDASFSSTQTWFWLGVAIVFEAATVWSAVAGWKLYVDRANALAKMDVRNLTE